MNTISEPTIPGGRRAGSDGNGPSRQQPTRSGALVGTPDCVGKAASRRTARLQTRKLAKSAICSRASAATPHIITEQGGMFQTSDADTSTLFAVETLPCFHRLCRPASGHDQVEKLMYGALAGGTVAAVGYGLYWIVELLVRWPVFNSGIEKLVH